jgi:hypothetical protein
MATAVTNAAAIEALQAKIEALNASLLAYEATNDEAVAGTTDGLDRSWYIVCGKLDTRAYPTRARRVLPPTTR